MLQTSPTTGAVLWVGTSGAKEEETLKLAIQYTRDLFCEHSLRSGPLFDAKAHPDFKLIEPETVKAHIKIESIRDLTSWSQGRPQIAKQKIAVIYKAEAMNLQAANALLKTLEEPALDTLFLLLTHHINLLPATLRSRCYVVRLRSQEKDLIVGQDPVHRQVQDDLNALKTNLAEPIVVAANWIKSDIQQVLYWLMVVLCEFTNNSVDNYLVKSRRWWRFMDEVLDARRLLENRTQANSQLLVETLLIQYARIMSR